METTLKKIHEPKTLFSEYFDDQITDFLEICYEEYDEQILDLEEFTSFFNATLAGVAFDLSKKGKWVSNMMDPEECKAALNDDDEIDRILEGYLDFVSYNDILKGVAYGVLKYGKGDSIEEIFVSDAIDYLNNLQIPFKSHGMMFNLPLQEVW